jgi:hypothetical protein
MTSAIPTQDLSNSPHGKELPRSRHADTTTSPHATDGPC